MVRVGHGGKNDAQIAGDSPIGRGYLETAVDVVTGNVTQSIGGGGNATITADQEDNVVVHETNPGQAGSIPVGENSIYNQVQEAVKKHKLDDPQNKIADQAQQTGDSGLMGSVTALALGLAVVLGVLSMVGGG